MSEIDYKGEIIKIYNSKTEAANDLGLKAPHHIHDVCQGKRKSCGGFGWKLVD